MVDAAKQIHADGVEIVAVSLGGDGSFVVCDDPEPICDFIVHELNRSASVFHATGAYSGPVSYTHLDVYKRQAVYCAVSETYIF